MLVVFITRLKQRILKGLRFAFVLAVIAILLVQLIGLLKGSGLTSRDSVPGGNPMKVQGGVIEACDNDFDHGALEKIIDYLLNNHRDKK
ncbi:hypothetical protein [Desulforamulus aquiferis]|uniref:Uncharacterized protein n=1 Tax=Desulforamulus aquiferis TaxID=1397668 RepID=A0AAW7ZAT4_9FIRM|nr:hypothetical protein [Desulforamulus aquiferis]MDO7786431.1 hypothetical protein [Desulforamulus aquiferis]